MNRSISCALILGALYCAPAAAAERIYFPAKENVTNVLVQYINNETVRLDISAWYLTEHSLSIAIANRFRAGVPVRLIGDRGAIFEIDPNTRNEFYWLANQGVPIRLRVNPTWYPEIDHWKAAIFVGQNTVEFGSANWVTSALAPDAADNYSDETAFFTDDAAIVDAFKAKFDRIWNDTTTEPESLQGGPPYLKNWADACRTEPMGCDFFAKNPNAAPMVISTARLEPDAPTPAGLIWGQGPGFNNRLIQEINSEPASGSLQFVIYRLTVDTIADALIARFQAGVQMQLIIEPSEYLNSKWPEFWLTHAYIDKLWAAGIPIKRRKHIGLTHMKTLVTSAYATNASSNYAAAWQRDHDYFVSAAAKPAVYGAIKQRVTEMWNDPNGFETFQPQPPNAPTLSSPASGATGTATSSSLVWNRATFATDYDVYMGFASGSLTKVANVKAQLVNDPPTTYSWTPGTALCAGTTYFWKVVSRTNATPVNASIVASSSTRSFTTNGTNTGCAGLPGSGGGGGGGGASSNVPAPWTTGDIGSVGLQGAANYTSGTFTIDGAGSDIWGSSDSFRYVFQPLSGDGQIVARVTSIRNTHTWAKGGVMLRGSTSAGSAHILLDVTPGGTIEFLKRASDGATTSVVAYGSQTPPAWLRLARSGSTVTAAVSADGTSWTTVGSTTITLPSTVQTGLAVTSHDTTVLNRVTFDNVALTAGGTPPPPPPPSSATDVVIYAGDIPAGGLHGSWSATPDATAAGGTKLTTPDAGFASVDSPIASPTHYVDVSFSAAASTPYTIWLRLKALNNSKYNDAVWVQFSDALVGGSPAHRIGTTSGLLVNLATDSTASSLNNWGWQNTAYWLDQATTVTFGTTGTHTLRIQVREDGVQLDQIVLSAGSYLNGPPGSVTNDNTVVPKP